MIQIEIETGDIRDIPANVVVLKHAQSFYGADAIVAATLMQGSTSKHEITPAPGHFALVPSGGAIASSRVLFLGVVPLFQFDYPEIRAFAARALEIVADKLPNAEHIAMTMHGAGYGLDEREAFRAEIAGLWETADAVPSVRKITIVERDPARARRLNTILDEAIRAFNPLVKNTSPKGATRQRTNIDAGTASRNKPHVFVAMPFSKELEDVYVFGIQNPINTAGFLCERVDMVSFTGDILDRIKSRIQTASLVVADLTGANANVYLEVGYAWGIGRPTLLLARQGDDLKFDVRGQRCIVYENIVDLAKKLKKDLSEIEMH